MFIVSSLKNLKIMLTISHRHVRSLTISRSSFFRVSLQVIALITSEKYPFAASDLVDSEDFDNSCPSLVEKEI